MTDSQDNLRPLVSIVIPAYNAYRTLAQTLDSVLAQTYSNIEVIVVNDGSTDGTADVLRAHADKVRGIDQPNGGLARARNTGCRTARGEFIALMDADDLCTPERIAVQVAAFQSCPEAVLCCSDFSAFNAEGPVSSSHSATYYSRIGDAPEGLSSLYPGRRKVEVAANAFPASQPPADIDVYVGKVYGELVHGNFVHPPTVMFRRSLLETAGMFDETLRYTCDWEWMVRAARIGAFVHVDRSMLDYRLSETQMSASPHQTGQRALDTLRGAMKIWHSDPDLMSTDRARMQASLGGFCLEAAYVLAEQQRVDAARMLARSIWTYGLVKPVTVKTAFRILMPLTLVELLRRLLLRSGLAITFYQPWDLLLSEDFGQVLESYEQWGPALQSCLC